MKKIKFLTIAFMALFMSMTMASCDNDVDEDVTPPVEPEETQDYHFDLWIALDRHGGMGRDVQTLVRSVDSLEADQDEITFVGEGTEVNSVLTLETILKGAYYYQVPVSGDRFAKYTIVDNKINVVAERRFETNTYSARKYTHAWLDESTLIIMAAAGDAKSIIWTKLNADDMTIIDEGTLDIALPDDQVAFTTSGILRYRASDDKLFYFFFAKGGTGMSSTTRNSPMRTAVIDPSTMAIVSDTECFLDCEMVGTAYGELLQTTTVIDDENNLYIACKTDEEDGEHSHLLKIPANSTQFDESYDGFTADGKLISILYLGGTDVVGYARTDDLGTGIDSFSHYYTVINLNTKVSTPIKYNGEQLAYSSGRFSSRMAYVDNKAYIGVDAEGTHPVIYIYDARTKTTTKGAELMEGVYFEQIRVVDNLD